MFQFRWFPPYGYVFTARCIESVYAGFPIRRSTDRGICAPPRGFSQLVASFIGSRCQGIRPVLLTLDLFHCTYSVTYSGLLCFFSRFGRLELFVTFLACKECFSLPFLYSVFKVGSPFPASGLEKTRTSDLALIRRAL